MARYDKLAVLDKMKSTGMVPVFYHPDIKIVKHVVKACYDGGVRVFEFTNRGDMAQDVFVIPGNHDVGNDESLKPLLEPKDRNWKKHQKSKT